MNEDEEYVYGDFNPDILVNRTQCAMKLILLANEWEQDPSTVKECQRWLDLIYQSIEIPKSEKKGGPNNVTTLH